MTKKIGLISGSLRKGSYNTLILKTVKELFPEGYEAELIEIGNLPFYNEDIDAGNPPTEYTEFRNKIGEMDAFVFSTPEYNRSIPGVIKNAIDVGSRPYGQSKWDGKPAGVISATIGGTGAMAANHALRQVFVFTNLQPMQQPEAYLANMSENVENGEISAKTREYLQKYVDAFVAHIERLS